MDNQSPKFLMLLPHVQSRRELDHTHPEAATLFLSKVHAFRFDLVKLFHVAAKLCHLTKGFVPSKKDVKFMFQLVTLAEGIE